MNMATATGRVVYPQNFNREMFIRFNLPPLCDLMDNFIPSIVDEELAIKMRDGKTKEYIRRGDDDDRQTRKLKFATTSSSVGNYHVEQKSKFYGFNV